MPEQIHTFEVKVLDTCFIMIGLEKRIGATYINFQEVEIK